MSDDDLLQQVNNVIGKHGCVATDIGPDAVGVMGDARYVGAAVFVNFPGDMEHATISQISNEITNKVRGIARVLMEIS